MDNSELWSMNARIEVEVDEMFVRSDEKIHSILRRIIAELAIAHFMNNGE